MTSDRPPALTHPAMVQVFATKVRSLHFIPNFIPTSYTPAKPDSAVISKSLICRTMQ